MDVSGWTVDQRMRLPDWCFGNREMIGCRAACPEVETYYWGISDIVLPDPVAIWSLGWVYKQNEKAVNRLRFGLRSTIPTSTAQMDTAVPILPYFGNTTFTPPMLVVTQTEGLLFQFNVRKGMATGGKKLVIELWSTIQWTEITFFMVVSGLPTNMAGWLAHNKV